MMTDVGRRTEVLGELTELILDVRRPHPVRVAVDGCSAAGKTTLADEIADVLQERTDREVIRVGIDYFKKAPELRKAYPPASPESYYRDSWDNEAIRDRLLLPLGPGGDRRYTAGVRDLSAGVALGEPMRVASATATAIVVADGAFLQRPELRDHWDLRLYVHVGFGTVLQRGIARDQAWMDSADAARARYESRYIPGERLYVAEVDPRARADVVIDNEDVDNPVIVGRGAAAGA